MKVRNWGKLFVGLGIVLGVGGVVLANADKAEASTLYRAYNPNTGEHLYTQNGNEIPSVVRAGWRNEGTAWEAPSKGTTVYRMFNPNNGGDHHYTINTNEVNMLKSKGWRYEGESWKSGGSTPVYRLYNPNARSGAHHFTTLASEKNNLVSKGWRYEGIAFYSGKDVATPAPAPNEKPATSFDVNKTQNEISTKLLSNINNYRKSKGLRSLDGSNVLNQAADIRANDLYTLYEHERPDGTNIFTFIDTQLGYNRVGYCNGENIWGKVYKIDRDTPDTIANDVLNDWNKSDGHRKLIETATSNEGAIGVKLEHKGTTYYDISVVFLSGVNSNKV